MSKNSYQHVTPEFVTSLRFNLNYDPASGHFTWRISGSNRYAGDLAGFRSGSYLQIKFKDKTWYSHVLAYIYMTGKFPAGQLDHKNRDGADNRWDNLRVVTASQNMVNRNKFSNNSSGTPGVSWRSQNRVWIAYITVAKKRVSLGTFYSKEAAIAARKIAEAKYHGEFAPQE